MAQQGAPLKGLFGADHEGMQDIIGGSSSIAAQQRKKASRSPLRARQQQSSNMMDLENTKLGSSMKSEIMMKSRSGSPDANKTLMNMMMKKEEGGSATSRTPHSYNNPTFISKPTTPRGWSADRPQPHGTDHDWEKIVADGKGTNDGTHLIRLLADFIEEFQFGSNHGKGEYASWVHDPKSLPIENRHSHQLAGQLRKLADVFESENSCSSLKEKRLK